MDARTRTPEEIFGAGTVAVTALAGLAAARRAMRVMVQIEQTAHPGISDHHDITTTTAVAPVGSAERLELLPVDGGATVAAVTAPGVDDRSVDERGHRR